MKIIITESQIKLLLEKFFESFDYEDEYVSALLRFDDGILYILDWNSKNEGLGNTKLSLQKLNKKYPLIIAIDCGYPHEPQFNYWKHMLDLRLIEAFKDDEGTLHN